MQKDILEANPEAPIRVYAVYFEMISDDRGARSKVDPREHFSDPRVRVYWDDGKLLGRWYEENVTTRGRPDEDLVEWDAFFIYGQNATWTEHDRPPLSRWGRPLNQSREQLVEALQYFLDRGDKPTFVNTPPP